MQFHRRARPSIATRLFLLFCLAQVVPISDVLAQPALVVNYGPGIYGQHRRRIIDFVTQSRTIADDIAQIEAIPKYCTQKERLDAGAILVAARAHLDALNTAWTAYKLGMGAQFSSPAVIAAFTAAGENPLGGGFWARADQEVITFTAAALAAAEARWRASVVQQCQPNQNRTPTPPPGPPPPAPRTNPLAGFTRPRVPVRAALPSIPRPFCTVAEMRAWEAANITPVLDETRTASNAMRVYRGRLYDEIQVQRAKNDTAAVRVLEAEFKWAARTNDELNALYNLFARLRDSLAVIDCSQPRTPPRPQPSPAAPRPDPRTGLARPTLPSVPRLPRAPASFCTDSERAAWVSENIDPLLEEFYSATAAIQAYRLLVLDAMKRPAVDSSLTLEGELQWLQDRQAILNARYFELIALRNGLTVVPCDRPRTQERPNDPPRVGRAPSVRIGLSGEYAYFDQFRKVVGNQPGIAGITGSNGAPGIGAGIGIDWGRKSCALSGHGNSLTYEQTYTPGAPNVPVKSMGTVDGLFVDGSCGLMFQPLDLIEFTPYFGLTYAIDRLKFTDTFGNGVMIDGDRSVNHLKTNFGFKIIRPLFNDFDLQFDVTRTTGRFTGDADANTRVGLGVFYNFRF